MVIIVVIIIQCLVWHGALRRTADGGRRGRSGQATDTRKKEAKKAPTSLARHLGFRTAPAQVLL